MLFHRKKIFYKNCIFIFSTFAYNNKIYNYNCNYNDEGRNKAYSKHFI